MSLLFPLNEVTGKYVYQYLQISGCSQDASIGSFVLWHNMFYMLLDCIFSYVLIRNITLLSRKDNQVELLGKVLKCIFRKQYSALSDPLKFGEEKYRGKHRRTQVCYFHLKHLWALILSLHITFFWHFKVANV